MKKIYYSSLILILFFINSCKQSEVSIPQDLTLQEAREFFQNNFAGASPKNSTITVSGNNNKRNYKKTIFWNAGMEKRFKNSNAIVAPFQYDDPLLIKTQTGKITPIGGMVSMVMYKDKNKTIQTEIVKRIPDNLSNRDPKKFSGLIIVEDIEGKFIRGFSIAGGKTYKLSYSGEQDENSTKALIVVCNKVGYRICAYGGCGEWGYDTYCRSVEIDGPGGEGEPQGGGGQSGSDYSTGSPSVSDYAAFYNLQDAEVAFKNNLNTTSLSPCVTSILSNIQSLSTNGNIQGIVYKFSSSIPGWNWEIKTGTQSLANTIATTSPVYNRILGRVTTTFNPAYLAGATDLSIAKTLMHEAVHAYLVAYFGTNYPIASKTFAEMVEDFNLSQNLNTAQHNEMVRSFVTSIGDALKDYGESMSYNLPDQFYYDLSWGGLTDTPVFNSDFNLTERTRIKNVINIELEGKDVNGNIQPQKGASSGC